MEQHYGGPDPNRWMPGRLDEEVFMILEMMNNRFGMELGRLYPEMDFWCQPILRGGRINQMLVYSNDPNRPRLHNSQLWEDLYATLGDWSDEHRATTNIEFVDREGSMIATLSWWIQEPPLNLGRVLGFGSALCHFNMDLYIRGNVPVFQIMHVIVRV